MKDLGDLLIISLFLAFLAGGFLWGAHSQRYVIAKGRIIEIGDRFYRCSQLSETVEILDTKQRILDIKKRMYDGTDKSGQ